MLDTSKKYTRRNSVLYDENGKALITFQRKYHDFDFNTKSSIEYVNRYVTMNPQLVTIHQEEKPKTEILTLF